MNILCIPRKRCGFSLIEVVLALGIFLITVVALVGLLGPTLQSVDEVEQTDEVSSVVNTVNAFLQSSPDIAANGASRFESIFKAVESGNSATLYVYRYYFDGDDADSEEDDIAVEIGFDPSEKNVGADSIVNKPATNPASFINAAGPIYRVVLSVSPTLPVAAGSGSNPIVYRDTERKDGVYPLTVTYANYQEGYFTMEVRIFARPADMAVVTSGTMPTPSLAILALEDPILTYNTAIVR